MALRERGHRIRHRTHQRRLLRVLHVQRRAHVQHARVDVAEHPVLQPVPVEQRAEFGDVRGQGGMLAMEFVKDRTTKEPDPQAVSDILAAAHQRGLALISAGMYSNVVRVLVPLNITNAQLQQGLDILSEAIATVANAAATAHSVS